MAPARDAFRARLQSLPPSAAVDFLADLFEAEGWTVQRSEGWLTLTRDGGTWTVALAGMDEGPDDADVVVTRGDAAIPGSADQLDADDLYERTLYAVDGADRARILRTHFADLQDEPPIPKTADEESDTHGTEPNGVDPPEPPSRSALWTRRALLLGGGAALGAGLASLVGSGSGSGMGTPTPAPPTPSPTPDPPAVAAPGLTADGVADPAALADAHATVTDTRSFALSFAEFRHDPDLELRSAITLDMSISADRSYLAVVATAGQDAPPALGQPPARSVYWTNGKEYYVDDQPEASGGVSSFWPLRGWAGEWRHWSHVYVYGGDVNSGPADYFASVFGALPTRLVGRGEDESDPRYRIEGRSASPDAPLELLTGNDHRELELSATVDATGLVRRHDLRYRASFDGQPETVRRTLEYSAVGETTVTRPQWVP